ncbi:MAG TPA: PilN domain-containing protein [Ramlibacter sp.]|uniref:PilN domain-containing protein n=1 Tax=Ramlibacter sp. TaxID=1917967 RepID=UPI002C256F45|nr:PilN domain-containing protein [Ramlibacter sp.]HVZ42387.1 PilN domain-containing protein [Ramlibacter sp.]
MILINLLPHREAARKRRQEAFFVSLGASALAGGLIAGGIFLWYAAQISAQENRNALLNNEIKRLEAQIKDIANLQQEIAALRARQQAVEDLQADRNMPVYLLNELVKQLPDGVYITKLKQENQIVTLDGVAQSNERVSELLRNMGNNSPWLTRPELVEIVAANISLAGSREQRRVSNFTMRVKLLRASEVQKAAPGASGASMPANAASAAAGASQPVKVSAAAEKPASGAQKP